MRTFISAVILVTAVTGAIAPEGAKAAHLPDESPWLVHLDGKVPRRFYWGIPYSYVHLYCGGTILNSRWIISAAHCFRGNSFPGRGAETAKYWHMRAGKTDKSPTIGDRYKDVFGFGASKIVVHEIFIPTDTWKHDIALVKVDRDLPVGGSDPNIGVATLPGSDVGTWPEEDTQCYMKGWGCTANGDPMSETAQTVELPAKASLACDVTFGNISETRMCAGHNLASKGICRGDSGGPLLCKKNGTWVLAGLASYTSASSRGNVPGVFTRVSYYIDWIQEVIRNETNTALGEDQIAV